MKIIVMDKGNSVKVDDNDFDWLSDYKWSTHSQGYAVATIDGRPVLMHRLIMGTPEGMDTDHINRDKSDNQRANLRVCTHAENMRNRSQHKQYKRRSPSLSDEIGINWHKQVGKWSVRLQVNKVRGFYGYYDDKSDAIAVSRRVRSEA